MGSTRVLELKAHGVPNAVIPWRAGIPSVTRVFRAACARDEGE